MDAIRRSRDNPDFHLRPLAPRIRQFVWEVLLQGKVIRERPLPGLAHAFVFWGFCAFALITLNHLAAGFGFPFLSRDGGFGKVYFAFVAVWAVAVAVSIAGLAIRRFVARPALAGQGVAGIGDHRAVHFHLDGYVSGRAGRWTKPPPRRA